jgi:hypothetical protein
VTPSAALFGYSPGGAVLTLVLPLGLFIVVMIGVSVVFRRPRAAPGRQLAGARAVPPAAGSAAEDEQPDGDDTAVIDTLVSDTAGGARARDSAVGDVASGDTPSGDVAAGDPAAPGTPEVPE